MRRIIRQEWIEQYLNGDLSELEWRQLENDSDFQSDLELHHALQEHLGDRGEVRLRKILAELSQNQPGVRLKSPFAWQLSSAWQLTSIAAFLVLVLMVVTPIWQSNNHEAATALNIPWNSSYPASEIDTQDTFSIPASEPSGLDARKHGIVQKTRPPHPSRLNYLALSREYYQEPTLHTLRQPEAPASNSSPYLNAERAYLAGDYDTALLHLAETDSIHWQAASFLAGHSLYHLGRFKEAKSCFTALINANSLQYKYQSEWGLLISSLAEDTLQQTEIRQLLRNMTDQPQHPYFEPAKELLKQLGK